MAIEIFLKIIFVMCFGCLLLESYSNASRRLFYWQKARPVIGSNRVYGRIKNHEHLLLMKSMRVKICKKTKKGVFQMFNKKMITRVFALAMSLVFVLSASPVFASETMTNDHTRIVDGVDIGEFGVFDCEYAFNAYLAQKNSRFFNNSRWYHSPSFSNNVQIGGGVVFTPTRSLIEFFIPIQRNLNEPWSVVSITYQAIVNSTGAVRQGINRWGGGQVACVGLYNVSPHGSYRLNLANISQECQPWQKVLFGGSFDTKFALAIVVLCEK
jgi:hypothetical protein